MKTLLLLFLICTAGTIGFAQDVPPDSITANLKKLSPVGEDRLDDARRITLLAAWGEKVSAPGAAIRIWSRILNLSEAANLEMWQMTAKSRLGLHYGRDGQYYRACEYLFSALYLADKLGEIESKAYSLRLLGDYHLEMGQDAKALDCYSRVLTILKKGSNPRLFLICHNNIGLVYFSRKNYERAIQKFNYCLSENKTVGDKNIESYCLVNLAACYREICDYEKALALLNAFAKLNPAENGDLAFADSQKARIYLAMGDSELALKYARMSYARRTLMKGSGLEDINDALYLIYKSVGNENMALRHLEKFNAARNSNDAEMKRKQVDALRFSYENEKQRASIIALNENVARKNREQIYLFVGVLFLGSLGALMIFNNRQLQKKNRQIEEQRNQVNLVKEDLAATNVQLASLNDTLEERVHQRTEELTSANEELIRKNREISEAFYNGQSLERKRVASELHDNLGSTLSGLKWQLESLDTGVLTHAERSVFTRVMSRIDEAYAEVRLISHNLLPEELEKRGLSAALCSLISDLNRGKGIIFRHSSNYLACTLDKKGEMELYSICLELANNITKHAKATEASINLNQSGNLLTVHISDNGIGFSDQVLDEQRKGRGLKNLNNRAASINGNLVIKSLPSAGTEITLLLEINAYGQTT